MEQTPIDVVAGSLADYARFICAKLCLPHDQGNALLQQYLNLTARGFPTDKTPWAYELPTIHPEPLCHPTERDVSLYQISSPSGWPASYHVPTYPHHARSLQEQADDPASSMASTPNSVPPVAQMIPPGLQSGMTMTMDSDYAVAQFPQLSQQRTASPVGSVAEYDPLWVQLNNVDPATVENFASRMKFDELFTSHVIKPLDFLVLQGSSTTNGQPQATEIHLTVTGLSRVPPNFKTSPDFAIAILSHPEVKYPDLKACQGTNTIIEQLKRLNVNVTVPSGRKGLWREIRVFRGVQDLGSLWWVKTAFHLWRDQKDREAREKGQTFRRRHAMRSNGVPEGTKFFNGAFGVWQNGVFVPDEDQEQ